MIEGSHVDNSEKKIGIQKQFPLLIVNAKELFYLTWILTYMHNIHNLFKVFY